MDGYKASSFLTRVVGPLVSGCPPIKHGILYTKELDQHKYIVLAVINNN